MQLNSIVSPISTILIWGVEITTLMDGGLGPGVGGGGWGVVCTPNFCIFLN